MQLSLSNFSRSGAQGVILALLLASSPVVLTQTDQDLEPSSPEPAAEASGEAEVLESDADGSAEMPGIDRPRSYGSRDARSRSSAPPNTSARSGNRQPPNNGGGRRGRDPSRFGRGGEPQRRPGGGRGSQRSDSREASRGGSLGSGGAPFKSIADRNIFNQYRVPRPNRERFESRRSSPDNFTLVGVLDSNKGCYAFFDGSRSEFRKVLEKGQAIAGHTVAEIGANAVKLRAESGSIELRVGMQMRREEQFWQVVGGAITLAKAEIGSAPVSESASRDESEIVRRLMQQREQELK